MNTYLGKFFTPFPTKEPSNPGESWSVEDDITTVKVQYDSDEEAIRWAKDNEAFVLLRVESNGGQVKLYELP